MEIQGHRGFKGLYPENTIIGFVEAAELGVDVLEMDVCVSGDGKVVVSHEPYLNPKICLSPEGMNIAPDSALKYNLFKMDYAQIMEYDCGLKYLPGFPLQKKIRTAKPLLRQVLDTIEGRFPKMKYNVEIKADPKLDNLFTPEPPEYVNLVLEDIRSYNAGQRINLQSFDLRILEEIHKQSPGTRVALLVDINENILEKLSQLTFKPEIISPHYRLLDKAIVKKLNEHGFKIIPWTVNSLPDMQKMIDLKVDAIITDYPDRLMALLE